MPINEFLLLALMLFGRMSATPLNAEQRRILEEAGALIAEFRDGFDFGAAAA